MKCHVLGVSRFLFGLKKVNIEATEKRPGIVVYGILVIVTVLVLYDFVEW